MDEKLGALPRQDLLALRPEFLGKNFAEEAFQPGSVDLSVDVREIYRIEGTPLPRCGETIRKLLEDVQFEECSAGQLLQPGAVYLVSVAEKIRLPQELYGYASPKSSVGRNDIHVRLLADGMPSFDSVPRGFSGELWFLICSKHFPLYLSDRDRLLQLRIFNQDTRLDETDMRIAYEKHKMLFRPDGSFINHEDIRMSDHDGSLILTLDLEHTDEAGNIGYMARMPGETPTLHFNENGHEAIQFFEPIPKPKSEKLILESGRFYIFSTLEWVRVPPSHAAEMASTSSRLGEFRAHYAGFIDPGWGHGRDGSILGQPLVLEVRSSDSNLIVRHNQPVCKLKYELLRSIPDKVYGETGSNYSQRQKGVLLSKHFF